jgi:hypothetical protein
MLDISIRKHTTYLKTQTKWTVAVVKNMTQSKYPDKQTKYFGSKTGFSQIVLLLGDSLTQDELYTGQQLRDLKPKKKDITMNLEWMINEMILYNFTLEMFQHEKT